MNESFILNTVFAHRGYHDEKYPENSIPAFKKALRYKYNIELDVHLTKDEKIVVFHDFSLKRMCGIDKKIEDLTYKQIIKYNLLNTKYKIPLLDEVLDLVSGKVTLLIETKTKMHDGRLEEKLSELLDKYNGKFAIQSFSPFSIYWFKKNRPNYLRGLLSSDFKKFKINSLKKIIARTLISDIILKTNFISFDVRALPNSYVERKRKYKPIIGWTIKDKKQYKEYKKCCDNFICENMNEYIKDQK